MRPLGATWHDKHVAHVAGKRNSDCSRVFFGRAHHPVGGGWWAEVGGWMAAALIP